LGELKESEVIARSGQAFPEIMHQLLAPHAQRTDSSDIYVPRIVPLSGSWEDVNDYFYAQGWTDGLPIAVPSAEHVASMLAGARCDRDNVLGIIPPRMGIATAEKIAVNACMAG